MAKAKTKTKHKARARDYEVEGEASHHDDGDVGAWEASRDGKRIDIYLEKHPTMGHGVKWRRIRIYRATAREMKPQHVDGRSVPAATFADACNRVARMNAAAIGHVPRAPTKAAGPGALRAKRRTQRAAAKAKRTTKAPAKRTTKAKSGSKR